MPDTDARLPDTSDLESKIAGFVRSYIHAVGSSAASKEEALRWVCSGLECLLGVLLDGCNGWSGWVDGVHPATDMMSDSVDVISPVSLSVRGSALWGERGAGPFWIEPFLGSVEISESSDAIMIYNLKFGDAARGLGKVPFDKHLRRPDWFFPTQWLFTFSKSIP
jgi:hypothetical protein